MPCRTSAHMEREMITATSRIRYYRLPLLLDIRYEALARRYALYQPADDRFSPSRRIFISAAAL